MSRFVKNIFIFALLLIICMSPIIIFICYYEEQAYTCNMLRPYLEINRIYSLKDINASLIITGNSRADNSYNDSILSKELGVKCLNIGWSGYPFIHQYNVMIKTYLSHNKKPDYIIQEISPWAFLDHVCPKYSIEMLPYLNRKEFHFLENICPEITMWDRFRLIRYSGKIDDMIKELSKIKEMKVQYSPKAGFQKNYINTKQSLECDSTIIGLFKTYVKECINNNIKLIFVCSPIHEEGQRFFDMNGFWTIFEEIAKTNKIRILNYQNLYGNDTIYFANSMHLNKYGRDCFSKKIAHDLDSLNFVSYCQ